MSQRPSRHQMRRHARKMRRYGLEPMTIINPGDPLPETAFVVIIRWAWRYRSELTPFAVALATAAVAWWLHRHDPHWWPLTTTLAVASVPVLALAGTRIGLADLAERIYASTVTASIGAWLATATAAGPAQRPLPLLILIGTLVLAVPWWTHKRRRARVRVERKLAGWPETSQAIGLAVFCHPDGHQYTRDDLNWRFAKVTRRAGLGHWHAHEARHTAVSIMSHNGVPIQDISDTMGHKSTHVTETVYRHVIVPAIRGGATVMDDVFEEVANINGQGTLKV